jgi:putative aldouronate transport system substrate-binding protein
MISRKAMKLIGLILSVIMLFGVFAGCGQQKATSEDASTQAAKTEATAAATTQAAPADDKPSWQKDTSPITFDFYINESWYGQKWGESSVSKYITEKTGVTLNLIMPTGDGNEKLNTMIASNSLPDMVCTNSSSDGSLKVEASKQVYTLNELAEKYCPEFFKIAPASTVKWWTRTDGFIYGYPNFSFSTELKKDGVKEPSNQTFLVKKDMYEAIGKPDMSTQEGFLNALKAAKEKFPQVNGKPIIPFGTHEFVENGSWAMDRYLQDYLAVPYEKDGKYYDRITDPEYVSWMKTYRKANEMGLIARDIFIDKRPQIEEKMTQGRYFSMLYQYVDAENSQLALYKKDPNSVYIAIDGPKNSKGDDHILGGGGLGGWELNYITKNCKNPGRAMAFLAYWISDEGQKDFFMGKKGELWDDVDGKAQFKKEVLDLGYSDRLAFYAKYGAQDCYWMLYSPLQIAPFEPPYMDPVRQPREWSMEKKKINGSIYINTDPPADSPEGIISKKIGDKWGQVQTKLILAKSDADFDKLLNDFVAEREKLGYAKLWEYRNKQMLANKERAGMK